MRLPKMSTKHFKLSPFPCQGAVFTTNPYRPAAAAFFVVIFLGLLCILIFQLRR